MPNYNVTECLSNENYIVSASTTLTEGTVIGFYLDEDLYCGTVGTETSSSPSPLFYYDTSYSNYCECLSAITDSLNFKFISCNTLEEINIEANNFCNEYGLPSTGRTYEIQSGSELSFCATFQGLSPTGKTNYFYVDGPFNGCENCENNTPKSANTETDFCQEICTESGTTVVTITPPHPIWTDNYGTEVTELNMITLGGMNGLNN